MAQDKVIDRSTGVNVNGVFYFPLPGDELVDPCSGKEENEPCPGEPPGTCVCRGGHKHFNLPALEAKGYVLSGE